MLPDQMSVASSMSKGGQAGKELYSHTEMRFEHFSPLFVRNSNLLEFFASHGHFPSIIGLD